MAVARRKLTVLLILYRFIPGKTSLNDILSFIRQHGYQTRDCNLTFFSVDPATGAMNDLLMSLDVVNDKVSVAADWPEFRKVRPERDWTTALFFT